MPLADDIPGSGDEGVEMEKERLTFLSPEDAALHVLRLQKTYRDWSSMIRGEKRAVKGISFAVHPSEVFGLLGHNGAGKTTALKCLIGEHCCTAGSVCISGVDMDADTGKARSMLGYCPQFDALLELLTVKDHLELFVSLKGLRREAVDRALSDFGLMAMAHRRADVLSGGNRRRLSAAIALVGGPRLAVLDEPSCGLDPGARRALWAAVQNVVGGSSGLGVVGSDQKATAVLLTTHSMEEAEALSTRLGIMADGGLVAIGTAQQIKQRHSGTHELTVSLTPLSEDHSKAMLGELGFPETAIQPEAVVDTNSVNLLLESNPASKRGFSRARCVVRAQLENNGYVPALVLAEWWLQQLRGDKIEGFLRDLLGDGVELAENFGSFWRFRLPRERGGTGLPEIFKNLEEQKENLHIAEYTLTQATLEQIFNGMAQESATMRDVGDGHGLAV